MPIYRPRMLLSLSVPVMGDRASRRAQGASSFVSEFPVKVCKAKITANDHNHADVLSVTCDWKDIGCDPRLLANACGVFYMGNADERGHWAPTEKDVRFIGILTKPRRSAALDQPMTVELEFLDYTTLFLEAKPFGTDGVPDLSMRLDDAWRRIVTQTPGAGVMADRLVLLGLDRFPVLKDAVASRFAQLAKVATKPKTDAWAVWLECVGMCSLISYIYLDQCIVTTATHHYTAADPPKLVWGKNIASMDEGRNPFLNKGIGLASFDPITGHAVEARYPPPGDPRVQKKIVNAKKKGTAAKTREADEWEWMEYSSVTDQKQLELAAQRVYEERSRQELEGNITTWEMNVETAKGRDFDLLTLRSGDNIRIEFDPEDRQMLQSLGTESARVAYLVGRGYGRDVATIMARNMGDFALLDPVFYVKAVSTSLETDSDGGKFEISINYLNRILIDGNTAPPTK